MFWGYHHLRKHPCIYIYRYLHIYIYQISGQVIGSPSLDGTYVTQGEQEAAVASDVRVGRGTFRNFSSWWTKIGGGTPLKITRWWQLKYFLFSPLFGEDSHFDEYFSKGLKPPTRLTWNLRKEAWKMIFLFKQVIFRFHVCFRGCTVDGSEILLSPVGW